MPNEGGGVAIRVDRGVSVASRRLGGSDVHVVIVGCGRVGSELARSLERMDHTVSVIDMEPRAFQRWGDLFQGDKIVGRRVRP